MKPTRQTDRASSARAIFFAGVALASLAGCGLAAPKTPAVTVKLAESFSIEGQTALPDKWWTAFGDERLNVLVDRALSGNMTLKIAWDRLEQARAAERGANASLFPALNLTGDAARAVTKTDGTGPAPAGRTYTTAYTLGTAASYELDLWGRLGSSRAAAGLDTLTRKQDLFAAAMTLSAEVGTSYYRLVEIRGQMEILRRQIVTNEDYLRTITLRFRGGQVPAVDVLQQRQEMEALSGSLTTMQALADVEKNRLAVLTGEAPGGFAAPDGSELPALPELPRTGPLDEWIRRRPDIQSAFLALQAANRRTAAAIADRFPRLSLTASARTSAEKIHDLFDNWAATLAAGLVAPLIDGGARKAEAERARAVELERLHSFSQVLLEASRDVENALVREIRQREYLESLDKQLVIARQTLDRTLQNYKKGSLDFTRFLNALQAMQRLERGTLEARRDLLLFRIALYRAISGSWEIVRDPGGETIAPFGGATPNLEIPGHENFAGDKNDVE